MQHCFHCRRFLSFRTVQCPYCGSRGPHPGYLLSGHNDELREYKILADAIFIQDREYKLKGIIGQGSHGVVLKVADPGGKEFAAKLPLQFNEEFSNRVGNRNASLELSLKYVSHEVKMLKQATCEALIKVLYAGPVYCRRGDRKEELPALLMELAEGTLKDIIDAEMAGDLTVPFGEKLNIIRQLTQQLARLHREKIIHRDLSPHNIFIVDRQEEIRYILADFGTSKPSLPEANRDSSTRMAFHDRYMDPAILLFKNFRYDQRIDIYQLGVIITEVLLGEYWQSDDEETTAAEPGKLDFENEFLLKFARYHLSRSLVNRLRRATTLKINRRYPTAEAFRRAMYEAMEKEDKRTVSPKNQRRVKRSIILSYRRTIPPDGPPGRIPILTISYRDQRKIDIGTAEAVKIDFPDFRLARAKLRGPSFLKCRQQQNTITLTVDSTAVQRTIKPLVSSIEAAEESHFRIEFEARSRLNIKGVRSDRDIACKKE